jgi:hypothetical protein
MKFLQRATAALQSGVTFMLTVGSPTFQDIRQNINKFMVGINPSTIASVASGFGL